MFGFLANWLKKFKHWRKLEKKLYLSYVGGKKIWLSFDASFFQIFNWNCATFLFFFDFFTKNTTLMILTNISWLLVVIKGTNPTIIETLKEIASWSSKREKKMRVWSSHFYDLTPKEKRNKLPYHDEERCRNEIKLTSIDKLCFNTAPELGRGSNIDIYQDDLGFSNP